MSLHNVLIAVNLGNFQAFDHGKVVEQGYSSMKLKEGDCFRWDCAQFCGIAVVVSHENNNLKFRKLS
jgi:hypothetical protein